MTHRALFLLPACAALLSAARADDAPAPSTSAAPAPAASTSTSGGGEIVGLVERLRREREAAAQDGLLPASQSTARPTPRRFSGAAWPSILAEGRAGEEAESSLPSAWSLSGDGEKGPDGAGNARKAQKWKLGLDVPISHFWGKATLSAGYERSEAGTARDAESAAAPTEQSARLSLRQEIKRGGLSGSADVSLSGLNSRRGGLDSPGERGRNAKAEGSARLKWNLGGALTISGSHQSHIDRNASLQPVEEQAAASTSGQADAASTSEGAASGALDQMRARQETRWAVEREAQRRSASELGLEWKWSKSLSLSAQASSTRAGQEQGQAAQEGSGASGLWMPRWARDEDKAALALQRRTGGGNWGLKWSRAWAQKDNAATDGPDRVEDRRSDAVSLQAEQKVFGWLSVRGSWRLAGEVNYLAARESETANREAEARINGGLGALSLRYSDWSSAANRAAAPGTREYGVRYEAGGGGGLGLAVEYSVREAAEANPSSNWRVGVTYR